MLRFDARLQVRRIDTLTKMAEGAADVLSQLHQVEKALAKNIGMALVERFVFAYAGSNVHVPKDQSWFRAQRDEALVRDFDGTNHEELAMKYRMLKSSVYTVLKHYRRPTGEQPRAEMTDDVVEYVQALLTSKHGFKPDAARQAGHDVADMLAREFGGIQLTIPVGFTLAELMEHASLLKAFTGDNRRALARAHGLTIDQVDEVLAQYQRLPVAVKA